MSNRRTIDLLVLLCLLIIAGVRYYTPPATASELYIVPDEVEPAVAAQRLVTLGHLDIQVAAQGYPQRYPPLFSLLLTPAYMFAPQQLGAGILIAWIFALGMIGCVFAIGRSLSGSTAAGALAAALALCDPLPARHAAQIVTDIPAATLGLVSCLLLMLAIAREKLWTYAIAGVAIAVAAGLRSTSVLLALPWLALITIVPRSRIARLALLSAPLLLLFIATALYQQRMFGDWRRNGYQFWCPVPYDYPSLVFSPQYLASNLQTLLTPPMLLPLLGGAAGAALLAIFRRDRATSVDLFTLAGAAPISIVYLFYCFPYTRFHDLLLLVGCVYAGAGIAWAAQRMFGKRGDATVTVIALIGALGALALPGAKDFGSQRRSIAAALARYTPDDAIIITGMDEPYLEPQVLRGTHREILPADRKPKWSYAGFPVAYKKIENPQPPPRDFLDHRCPGILAGGAVDLYPLTAAESPQHVTDLIRSGRPVYLDMATSEPNDPAWQPLLDSVKPEQVPQAPFLVRLRLR
jgi:hypothetical protein